MSDGTFLNGRAVKSAPDIPTRSLSLSPAFALVGSRSLPGSVSRTTAPSMCRCTPGVLGSGPSCVVSNHHRLLLPHAPASQARCDFAFAYTQRLRCAGAPRRPTRPSLLSLPRFPRMPSTLPRRSTVPSRCARTLIPGFLEFPTSRHPQHRLYQLCQTDSPFRGCIVLVMLRPARLPSPPDWLRQDEVTCSSPRLLRYVVTPAFGVVCHQTTLGVRLDGRTGNLPSLGLSPNKSQQLARLHRNAG
jgi:hypothetical protein